MNNATVTVDFSKDNGQLRHRLHSSGYMPNISMQNIRDFSEKFAELNFLESRTHDQALTNPGQRVVDTHFIFPNMRCDPADPQNYYFDATDHLFETCMKCGTKIMYRLGTSIEHTLGRHFNAIMPDDFEKYAEVLAAIVRHYNRGWADGHNWNIKYWEIWNEADLGHQMWNSDRNDYHRFYCVMAKRLKDEFPEIKIGGPAYCNFEREKFTEFLGYCKDHGAPVDYISWHRYTDDVEDMITLPQKARDLLDEMGFTQTETMINEWHYLLTWDGLHNNFTPEGYEKAMNGPTGMFGIDSAAFNVSVVAGWHDTPLDSSYYYGCGEGTWGFDDIYHGLNKNYYSMYLLGQIITQFPNRVSATQNSKSISTLAAADDSGNCAVLLADYRGSDMQIGLQLNSVGEIKNLCVKILDQNSNLKEIDASISDGHIKLNKQESGSAVFFITFQR